MTNPKTIPAEITFRHYQGEILPDGERNKYSARLLSGQAIDSHYPHQGVVRPQGMGYGVIAHITVEPTNDPYGDKYRAEVIIQGGAVGSRRYRSVHGDDIDAVTLQAQEIVRKWAGRRFRAPLD